MKDPILDEIRAFREAYAKRFGYDVRKIGEDLRKKEKWPAKGGSRPSKQTAKQKRRAA